jgi:hypothetical protein
MITVRYGNLVIFYGKDITGKTIMKGISIQNLLKRQFPKSLNTNI